MLDFVAFILLILKFNTYCIWEPELNKKQAWSNAVKRFHPTRSRTSRIPSSDLIPIDHPLYDGDEGRHFSLSFSQTKSVLLSLGAHALEIESPPTARVTCHGHILPPSLWCATADLS